MGLAAAVLCSAFLFTYPQVMVDIVGITVILGLVYGCVLGLRNKVGGGGFFFGLLQGLWFIVIRVLPYPVLLLLITRNFFVWMLWLAVGIFLFVAYDAYYLLRKLQPSYRRMYNKYIQEGEAYYNETLDVLKNLAGLYAVFEKEETDKITDELNKEQQSLDALNDSIQKGEEQLKAVFAKENWNEMVNAFRNKLERQRKQEEQQEKARQARLSALLEKREEQESLISEKEEENERIEEETRKEKERLDRELKQAEENVKETQSQRKQAINREILALEAKKEPYRQEIRAEAAKITETRENEHQVLKKKFQDELNCQAAKMKEDGFKDVCKFDYREAWAAMHGMLTTLTCYPANLECFMNHRNIVQELLAAGQGIDKERLPKEKGTSYGFRYMPKNILWGASPCIDEELGEEIRLGLENALREGNEFQGTKGWDDNQIQNYGVKEAPWDNLYRLNVTDTGDHPLLLYYDLGDMDKEKEERKSLCQFIMRTFAFLPLFYIGNKDYFNCQILISDKLEDYKPLEQEPLLKGNLKISEKNSFSKTLDSLYEKGDKVRNNLKSYGSLYEKNRDICQKGKSPAKDDGYTSLIVTNMDYKLLSSTNLQNLLDLSCGENGNPCGIYPFLFVDLNRMRNHKDETDRASVDACKMLAKSFHGKCCELQKENGAYRLIEKPSSDELYNLLEAMS